MGIRLETVVFVIILGIAILLTSCSKEQEKSDGQPTVTEEHIVMPLEVQPADSSRSDTILQNKEVKKVSNVQAISNPYDDGLSDGEAMSEEDRLAGKPGMQVGMDDEDEDYEDGFDDGYEE